MRQALLCDAVAPAARERRARRTGLCVRRSLIDREGHNEIPRLYFGGMPVEIKAIRGMNDILPREIPKWRFVEE
ncbi:MAG TPA: hypothetical protein PLT30_04900, partial [Deltaproteobacteria bacterium]|nr:hypothetical protein [Deltaproteobacteria bacterium]